MDRVRNMELRDRVALRSSINSSHTLRELEVNSNFIHIRQKKVDLTSGKIRSAELEDVDHYHWRALRYGKADNTPQVKAAINAAEVSHRSIIYLETERGR